MSDIFLAPPIAFLIFVFLVGLLSWFGRTLAGPGRPSAVKSSSYASGEAAPTGLATPGYRPFFVVALFFAILHLGALVLAVGGLEQGAAVYLVGLALALLALILG